jgi:5-methylcytosine-specific restriction endonuclease McrA
MTRLEFSKRTMRDAYERSEGLCEGIKPDGERCCFPVDRKKHFDHKIPAALGGDNSLTNCAVLCIPCHDAKTRKIDVPMIAKAKRVADKHNGIKRPSTLRSQGFRKAPPQNTATRPIRKWAP